MAVKERLTLEDAAAPTLLSCEHTHRYTFAAGLLDDLRVVDLCCGSGYGTRTLAATAQSVHGVDNDAATVDVAALRAADVGQTTYETADALEFVSRPDIGERFDAIVCFEGLEHLPKVEAVVARLAELAQNGMRLILSVPNSKGLGEDNDYHLTDFSYESARELFAALPNTQAFAQFLTEGSLIVKDEAVPAEAESAVRLDERHDPPYANHYLVCVGLEPEELHQAARLETAPAYNRYQRGLERANEALRRTNARLARGWLGKGDAAAASLMGKLADAEAERIEQEADRRVQAAEHVAREALEAQEYWKERAHAAEAREQQLAPRAAVADRVAVRLLLKTLSYVQRPPRR